MDLKCAMAVMRMALMRSLTMMLMRAMRCRAMKMMRAGDGLCYNGLGKATQG